MSYEHPSAHLDGPHWAHGPTVHRGVDYTRLRLRILAMLRSCGPMATPALVRRLRGMWTEDDVRLALRLMADERVIARPMTRQRWECVR